MYAWILAAIIALSAVVVAIRGHRRRIRARLRARWGAFRVRDASLAPALESHRARARFNTDTVVIDDRTWADLNLDDVFRAIDRTESTLGSHALYNRLRAAPSAPHLDVFELLVARFSADSHARERAQLAVAALQDAHGYDLWWLADPAAAAPRWQAIFPALTLLTLVVIPLGLWWHLWPLVVGTLVASVAINYATLSARDHEAAAMRQVAPLIRAGVRLQFLNDDSTRMLLGGLAESPKLRRLASVARWTANNPLLLTPDPAFAATLLHDVLTVAYEYLNTFFLIDRTAVFTARRNLYANAGRLIGVLAAVGEVDAALSVASLRASATTWTRPRFAPGTTRIDGMRHPLVADAVPQSIELGPPHGVLVTGSNMSGKSTLLRTIGVAAVMAQAINTCCAETYEAPVFHVKSVIGRADDLLAGKSYYLVEVEALLGLVRASESAAPHLFLLDELFKGTNAIERIAAGESILRALIAAGPCGRTHVAVAATHDNELVELLDGTYAPFHFGDAIGPNGLVFDYQLKRGPALSRNAITLLKLQGAPDGVVERALSTAAALDRERNHRPAGA